MPFEPRTTDELAVRFLKSLASAATCVPEDRRQAAWKPWVPKARDGRSRYSPVSRSFLALPIAQRLLGILRLNSFLMTSSCLTKPQYVAPCPRNLCLSYDLFFSLRQTLPKKAAPTSNTLATPKGVKGKPATPRHAGSSTKVRRIQPPPPIFVSLDPSSEVEEESGEDEIVDSDDVGKPLTL